MNTTTANTKTTTATADSAVKSAPATTAHKFSDAAHKAVDSVSTHLADAERKLRSEASNKEEALREAAGTATEKASEWQEKTKRYINDNPMTAAGIAFAAGIVFSGWLRK